MYSIVDRSYGKLYISSRNPHKPEKILGFNANYNYRFLLNKSENFLLTLLTPSPFPSPQWGEGGGEGKFQIYLVRFLLILAKIMRAYYYRFGIKFYFLILYFKFFQPL
jgi:hypothetical protein